MYYLSSLQAGKMIKYIISEADIDKNIHVVFLTFFLLPILQYLNKNISLEVPQFYLIVCWSRVSFWKPMTVQMVSESSQLVNEWVVMLQRRVEQTSLLFSSLHTKRPMFIQLWHFNLCGWKVLFGNHSLMPFRLL